MDSGQHAPEGRVSFTHSVISFLVMLVIVLGCAWLIRSYVIAPYEIPSSSMETTIMTDDKVFSEKVSYYARSVQPGDIVTFQDPEVSNRTLIKRCIAIGGQTVDLRDGVVYVDGQALSEPYTNALPSYPLQTAFNVQISYPYTVPDGYLWMMGDNRTNSADSRYFGAVPESSVTGRGCFIYWPLNHFGVLK